MALREPSKAKSVARVSGDTSPAGNLGSVGVSSTEKEKKRVSLFITDEIYSTLLDVSFKRMLKKSANSSSSLLELWNEELEGKSDFSNYRTKLVCLVFSWQLSGPCPLPSMIFSICLRHICSDN